MGRDTPATKGTRMTTTLNGHATGTPPWPPARWPLDSPGQSSDVQPQAPGHAGTAPDTPGQAAAPRRYPWPLMVIAAPAAVAVWSGWVGLGAMCGFGVVDLLPGIATLRVNTAITLPVGIESYGAYALASWISGKGSARTRTFAFRSAVGALALGCLGQVAFHLLAAAGWTVAPWPVVMAVACLPVVTLSFAAALVHLKRADAEAGTACDSDTTAEDMGDSGDDTADSPPPPLSVEEEAARDDVTVDAVRKRRKRAAAKAAADRSAT